MRTNLRDQFNADQRAEWKPKIIARNTFKFTRDGETVIRLHGTDVVTKHADGSVTLDSGGWKTVTTKERMNNSMPGSCRVYQDGGQWYVSKWTGDWSTLKQNRVPFFDGIRVPQCFDKPNGKGAKIAQSELKLRGQIKKFVAKLDKLECLPEPSAGDCFYCQMHVTAGKDTGKSLGDATGDAEHLRSHVEEGYLHGSLIMNALQFVGYRDPGFIWHMENRNRAEGRKADFAKRALRKYLYRKLGLVS